MNEPEAVGGECQPGLRDRDRRSRTRFGLPNEILAFDVRCQTPLSMSVFLGLGRPATNRPCGVGDGEAVDAHLESSLSCVQRGPVIAANMTLPHPSREVACRGVDRIGGATTVAPASTGLQ